MPILDDTRADWNARPPLRTLTRVPWSERIGVSWHWIGPGKGPSAAGSHQKCLDQVRDWQAQHQDPNGRIRGKDLGYNALICQHARAIEGRGLQFSGAHSPGVNYAHVGVQFMVGTDTPGGVSAAMYARAVRLRADVGALGKNIRRDWGHRDDPKVSTECPGDRIYKWVHSGGPTAKAPTITPQEDDDMQLSDLVNTRDPKTGELVQVRYSTLLARQDWVYHETLRQKAVLDAIASKLLTAAEVEAAAEKGAAEGAADALDAKIADATTVLEVKQ